MRAKVSATAFRLFANPADVHLRPITLLYGRNQSGKSTMLRLLVAIGESMRSGAPVFAWNSPALAPAGLGGPTIHLATAEGRERLSIKYVSDDPSNPAPSRLAVWQGDAEVAMVSESGPGRIVEGAYSAPNDGTLAGSPVANRVLTFRSIFPEPIDPAVDDAIGAVRTALAPLAGVQWLAMTRPVNPATGGVPVSWCLPDGTGLAKVALDNSALRGAVEARLRTAFRRSVVVGTRELVHEQDPARRFVFTLSETGGAELGLDQSGEGMRWLVPLVACFEWARLAKSGSLSGPSCLAIEEPEARLHPKLQVPLADQLFDLAAAGIPCIVETHSVHVLRALQLAVAERRLLPDDVALHWFDDEAAGGSVVRIPVREDGTLEGWRPDVFEEEQDLTRKLFEQRWRLRGAP